MMDQILQRDAIALIWVADRSAPGPEAYSLVAAAAGLAICKIVVLDTSAEATTSLALRRMLGSRGSAIIRLPAESRLEILCRTALEATPAPILWFCDAATRLDPRVLRRGFEQIADGAVDGWAGASPAAYAVEGPLPARCRGALLNRDAVAALAARCAECGADPGLALSGVPRLTTQPRLTAAAVLPPDGVVLRSDDAGAPPASPPREPLAVDSIVRFGEAVELLSRRFRASRPTLLLIGHALGGGTTRYQRILGRLVDDRVNVVHAWGESERRLLVSASAPDAPEVAFDLPGALDAAVRLFRALKVRRVDVLHSIGLDDHIEALLDRLDVPYDLTLMDYHHFATMPHLLDDGGRFVGDPALLDGSHPMRRHGSLRRMIAAASRRVACSRDLAARLTRLAPDLAFLPVRIPEPQAPHLTPVRPPARRVGEPARIVFTGRFNRLKGSAILLEVARLCRERGLPIEFHVLGYLEEPVAVQNQRQLPLTVYGNFREEQVHGLLTEIHPHLAWFPFTAPETYSFTLSDAMAHGLPILTVGLGAVPERLDGRPYTWIQPPEEATPGAWTDIIDRLCRENLATPPRWLPAVDLPALAEDFYERDYLTGIMQGFDEVRDVERSAKTVEAKSAVVSRWGVDADPTVQPETARRGDRGQSVGFSFVIRASDLRCHDSYLVNGWNTLRHGAVIEYRNRPHAGIGDDTLFFGPYIPLTPAIYLFTLDGDIEGSMTLEFVHEAGSVVLKQQEIESFRDPVCLAVVEPLTNFEIRGRRSASLERLRLEAITVDSIRFGDAARELECATALPARSDAGSAEPLVVASRLGSGTGSATSGYRSRLWNLIKAV